MLQVAGCRLQAEQQAEQSRAEQSSTSTSQGLEMSGPPDGQDRAWGEGRGWMWTCGGAARGCGASRRRVEKEARIEDPEETVTKGRRGFAAGGRLLYYSAPEETNAAHGLGCVPAVDGGGGRASG